jgi:hypothetical protein
VEANATESATRIIRDTHGYGEAEGLLAGQDLSYCMVDYHVENGETYLFQTSKVSRVGQLATRWRALKEYESYSLEEKCAIGNSILPQVSSKRPHVWQPNPLEVSELVKHHLDVFLCTGDQVLVAPALRPCHPP